MQASPLTASTALSRESPVCYIQGPVLTQHHTMSQKSQWDSMSMPALHHLHYCLFDLGTSSTFIPQPHLRLEILTEAVGGTSGTDQDLFLRFGTEDWEWMPGMHSRAPGTWCNQYPAGSRGVPQCSSEWEKVCILIKAT